mmetsp:Transcript_18174/g.29551  ORF Transcript_18174/g.29551 Transcript_18174/m.29551 type:complete len:99 (-) Transcript_18174:610-906(-)
METADATTKGLAEEIAIVTTVVEEKITMAVVEETMDNMRSQRAIMDNMFIMWRKSNAHFLAHHRRKGVLREAKIAGADAATLTAPALVVIAASMLTPQ